MIQHSFQPRYIQQQMMQSPQNIQQKSLMKSFPNQIIISDTQSNFSHPIKQQSQQLHSDKKRIELQGSLENIKKLTTLNDELAQNIEKLQEQITKKDNVIKYLQEELNQAKENLEDSVYEKKIREIALTNQKLLTVLEENEIEQKQLNEKIINDESKIQEQNFALDRLQLTINSYKQSDQQQNETINKITEYNKQLEQKNILLIEENSNMLSIIESNRNKNKLKDEDDRQRKKELEKIKEEFQRNIEVQQMKQEGKQKEIERKIDELEQKKKKIQDFLKEEQKKVNKQQLMNKQLEEKIQVLNQQNFTLDQELQAYKEIEKQQTINIEQKTIEIDQLNEKISQFQQEITNLKNDNKEISQSKKPIESLKEYLQKELENKETEIKKLNEQISLNNNKYNQLIDVVTQQEKQNSEYLKKNQQLQQIIQELENEKTQIQQETKESQRTIEFELKQQIQKNQGLESENHRLNLLNENLQKKFINQDQSIKEIEIENSRQVSALVDVNSRIEFLESENLQLEDEQSKLYQALAGKDMHINELKNQIMSLNQTIETQILELKTKESKIEKYNKDFHQEKENNEKKISQTQNEIKKIQQKLQEQETENAKNKSKIILQDQWILELQQNEQKTSNYNSIITENQKNKAKFIEWQNKYSQLQDENFLLKQQLSQKENQYKTEKNELENTHNEFIESLEKSQQCIEKAYKNRISELESQLNTIKQSTTNHAKMKLLESKCQNLLLSSARIRDKTFHSQYQMKYSKDVNKTTTSNLSTPGKMKFQSLIYNQNQFKGGHEISSYNLGKHQL